MAKFKQSPKLPAATRREQLLASAHRLFVDKGYRGTTMDDIARQAGLTKGAVYFHFRSKEEMLEALMERLSARFRTVLQEHLPDQVRPLDFLRIILVDCTWAHTREFRSTMDVWVQAIRIPRIRRQMNRMHREMVKFFSSRLMPDHGLSHRELEQLAIMVFSLGDGLAAHRVLNPKSIDVPQQLALFGRMLGGLGFHDPVQGKRASNKAKTNKSRQR